MTTTSATNKASEMHRDMEAKLAQLGIGFHTIKVFGTIRCNVHIQCISRDTANKWAMALAQIFPGSAPKVVPTVWYAQENKGTVLRPTTIRGFLIGVAA